MTNAESGQANTILVMALEASTRPHVEVHIASFPVLEQRVQRLSPNLQFHPLDGMDFVEMLAGHGFFERDLPHRPRTGVFSAYPTFTGLILAGWDGECTSVFSHTMQTVSEDLHFCTFSLYADIL